MTGRIGAVQAVFDKDKKFSGAGFVLCDDQGDPCVTFGFDNRVAAEVGLKDGGDHRARAHGRANALNFEP